MEAETRQKLTRRQQQVLEIINQSIANDGYPPTIREIGAQLGISSTNGVNDHLKALERKGYLNRCGAKSRAMVPVAANDDMLEVPMLGRIAAGTPILAVENVDEVVKVDPFFLGKRGNGELFALQVVGQSMIGDGIHDGDTIFVRKQERAEQGDVVAAWIDGEATVKRYYHEGLAS